MDPLDRPIWTALTTEQTHLGYGGELARRYNPEVAPFAAICAETRETFGALARLLSPGEQVLLKTFDPIGPIAGFDKKEIGPILQMVLLHKAPQGQLAKNLNFVRLGAETVGEMQDLVVRAKPGPFGQRTVEMGAYIGVRDNGRLVAMAGERIRFDGHVEISAVCVDPDYRGKGFARLLVIALSEEIKRRGDVPFLHVLADNESAIKLYEAIGFEVRRRFFLSALALNTEFG